MVSKTFYVQGMHCSSCVINVERTVSDLKGINKAIVSLADSQIVIEAESFKIMPSVNELNQIFRSGGYIFSEKIQKTDNEFPIKNKLYVIALFLIIVYLYLQIKELPLFSKIYLDSKSKFPAFFLFGIAAGFSSCAALVGGLLLSVQENWVGLKESNFRNSFTPFLLFNISRLFVFAIFGGLLGVLGRVIKLSVNASAVMTILISLLMVIIGMQMLGSKLFQRIQFNYSGSLIASVTTSKKVKRSFIPIVFGAITFFVPCGFTLIAQSKAIESGNFLQGSYMLLAFALGTLPVLLLISYSAVKINKNPKFSISFRTLSGLLIVFFAINSINSQFNMFQISSLTNKKTVSIEQPSLQSIDQQPINVPADLSTAEMNQVMRMEVKGFEYFPKEIVIKAGIPTRLEITDSGSIGCARSVFARGLYPDAILLQQGLNSVEFIAPEPGTYQISCSMWMVEPISVVVEK